MRLRNLITDDENWVRVSDADRDMLLKRKLIHECTGDDTLKCAPNTYHPMDTVRDVLEVLDGDDYRAQL